MDAAQVQAEERVRSEIGDNQSKKRPDNGAQGKSVHFPIIGQKNSRLTVQSGSFTKSYFHSIVYIFT